MAMQLDQGLCSELAGHVEQLTHSGRPTLDQDVMKKVKRICKQSDDYVKQVFYMTMTQLEKDHAEIRLSAFQIINELFQRSHCFRELLVSDFQNFLELTAETNLEEPLPLPKDAAKRLKTQTLEAVQKWYTQFGEGYKKLQLGYDFLKTCKKVNFEEINSRTLAQQREEERRQAVREAQRKARLEKILTELTEISVDIESCLTELGNCLCLLLPTPEDFQVPTLCDDQDELSAVSSSTTQVSKCVNNTATSTSPGSVSVHPDLSIVKHEKDSEMYPRSKQIAHQGKAKKSDSKKHASARTKSKKSRRKHPSVGDTGKCDSDTLPVVKKEKTDQTISQNSSASEGRPFSSASSVSSSSSSSSSSSTTSSKVHSTSRDRNHLKSTENSTDEKTEVSVEHIKKEKIDPEYGEEKVNIYPSSQERASEDSDVEFHEISSTEQDESRDGVDDDEEEEEETEGSDASFVRQHGLGSRTYNMEIVLTPGEIHLNQNPDNRDLIQSMMDMNTLVNSKYLPAVQRYLQDLTKNGADQKDIKKVIDLKEKLISASDKCQKIHVEGLMMKRKKKQPSDDEGSDSDDFEDVAEKDGYEPDIPEHLKLEYRLAKQREDNPTSPQGWSIHPSTSGSSQELDPTSLQASLQAWKERIQKERSLSSVSESSSKPHLTGGASSPAVSQDYKELLQKAPKVPFGVDLFHWNDGKDIEPPTLIRYDSLHRFWTNGANDEVVDKSAVESMKKRVINFTGEFEPVKWKCRVPLPNGQLCQRMDRKKCPFHGIIIARNELGQPVKPEDISKESHSKEGGSSAMEWEDPELQRQIEAATGHVLTRKKGKGKGKSSKKPKSNLTDLNKLNKQRSRLEKKILSKKALSRVAGVMNSLDARRNKEKFGDNYNYALSTR